VAPGQLLVIRPAALRYQLEQKFQGGPTKTSKDVKSTLSAIVGSACGLRC
jgi:hypothetical protein